MQKILVVDDTPTQIALARQTLEPAGFQCVTAASGLEAEAIAEKERPDLILLDVVMPGQDGFQTCRKLRKNPACARTPIVLVTSKNTESDRFWGRKQGANDYIVKPYSPDDLLARVRQLASPVANS